MSPSSQHTLTARATTASVVGRRLGGGRIKNINQPLSSEGNERIYANEDLRGLKTPTAMMMSSQQSQLASFRNSADRT